MRLPVEDSGHGRHVATALSSQVSSTLTSTAGREPNASPVFTTKAWDLAFGDGLGLHDALHC